MFPLNLSMDTMQKPKNSVLSILNQICIIISKIAVKSCAL